MRISGRLAKLEYALPPAQTVERTREEERILCYELARAFVKLNKFPALQDRLVAYADQTAAEICRKAALPLTDQYRDHISYVEEMWVVSGRVLPFIPPVVGSNGDEWFLPGLAERRLAVRRRPSVVALIGDTASGAFDWYRMASGGESAFNTSLPERKSEFDDGFPR